MTAAPVRKSGDREATLEQVLKNLQTGKTAPVYLLFGDETYLVEHARERIVAALLPDAERDLQLFSFEGEDLDVGALCDTLLTPSLLGGRKVVVVRGLRLLQSRTKLPELLQKARDQLETNPGRAARHFVEAVGLSPWTLEELEDDGWRGIPPADWEKATGMDPEEREAWLPRILEQCRRLGLRPAPQAGEGERLARVIAGGLPEGNHLVLTAETLDQRKSLVRQLADAGTVLSFSRVKGETRQKGTLQSLTREMLAASGKAVAPEAWLALGRKTGFDLAASRSALEKLLLFAGDKKTIGPDDVEEVIGRTREDSVFDLTAALAERNLEKALQVLQDLLAHAVPVTVVHALLVREVRFLLHARLLQEGRLLPAMPPEADYVRFQRAVYPVVQKLQQKAGKKTAAVSLLGQHPFVVFQALRNAGRFTRKELAAWLDRLLDMDVALKSTSVEPRTLFERFFAESCAASHAMRDTPEPSRKKNPP